MFFRDFQRKFWVFFCQRQTWITSCIHVLCTNAAACRLADMFKKKKKKRLIPGGNSSQTHAGAPCIWEKSVSSAGKFPHLLISGYGFLMTFQAISNNRRRVKKGPRKRSVRGSAASWSQQKQTENRRRNRGCWPAAWSHVAGVHSLIGWEDGRPALISYRRGCHGKWCISIGNAPHLMHPHFCDTSDMSEVFPQEETEGSEGRIQFSFRLFISRAQERHPEWKSCFFNMSHMRGSRFWHKAK